MFPSSCVMGLSVLEGLYLHSVCRGLAVYFLSSLNLCASLFSPGEQRGQIRPLRAQLQRIQQRVGSVSHRQKDSIIHHRPPIRHIVHVSPVSYSVS